MPSDELIELAALAGIDALEADDIERIDAMLARATAIDRADYESTLRGTREAMARVSDVTAMAPPPRLRDAILAAVAAPDTDVRRRGDTSGASNESSATVVELPRVSSKLRYVAAAAAIAVVAGVLGWLTGVTANRDEPQTPTLAEVFAAPDVKTHSGAIGAGRASVTSSADADAAVLVMNDVPPPKPGTVYQMWLEGPGGSMTSAGTMAPEDVAPSTTAVLTGVRNATSLSFTVEPAGGSSQPTSPVVAQLPLN